jgi:transcriptional regulator with XRE-family HTH domain
MSIGARIRDLRWDARLSQGELARRAGIAQNTLSLAELEKSTPSIATLAALANALGVTVDELVRDPAPLAQAPPPETGQPEDRKGPDPEVWGDDEHRPRVPMPESAGHALYVEIQSDLGDEVDRVRITRTSFMEMMRDLREQRISAEDAWQRLLDDESA